jgi:nitronate monooxygenase
VHAGGALACWQVGSRDEALAAARAGCDLIVAQGVEAGGHIRGRIGLFPLLAEVLDAVATPVIAAGGIGSGRTMAAALAAGASAVRLGTRFLAAPEAGIHPDYLTALIAARPEDTVFTAAFSGGRAEAGLGDAPHRVLASALAAAEDLEGDIVGEKTFMPDGEVVQVRRFRASTPTVHTMGTIAAMSQWAGESVGGVTRIQPAGEIVRELAEEAERLLRRWG